MPDTNKLLTVAITIGRAISANLRYRRVAASIATIVILTIATGMLATSLLIGAFYAAYQSMLAHGIAANAAAVIIGAGIALATLLCAALTIHVVRKLKNTLLLSPLPSRVAHIADAFIDGLMDK